MASLLDFADTSTATPTAPRTRRRRSAPIEHVVPLAPRPAAPAAVPVTRAPAAPAAPAQATQAAPSAQGARGARGAGAPAAPVDRRVFPTPTLPHEPPAPARRFRPGITSAQVGLAALSWGALVGVIYATSPATPAARVAFFLALFGGLFFTLAPLLRSLALRFSHSRIYQQAAGAHAMRQAMLLSLFVVLNALLLLVRAWSELNALLLFGTLAVIEVVALSRR